MPASYRHGRPVQQNLNVLGEAHPAILVSQGLNPRQTPREYDQALPEPFLAFRSCAAALEFGENLAKTSLSVAGAALGPPGIEHAKSFRVG